MPQAGGSATIYGVLYQLLGTVHWASKIQYFAERQGEDLTDVRLTIEPSDGGGDVRIVSSECRIVEQWKAKSGSGTWSVRQLVEEVFPDLYRAVETGALDRRCTYRFVTEGRRGKWMDLNAFLKECRDLGGSSDPVNALDDSEEMAFLHGELHTRLAFFNWIVKTLRGHLDIAADGEELTHKKLLHLLRNFEIEELRTMETLCREVNSILLGVVDLLEQVEPKRRELCGLLLEYAGKGNVTVTPQDLLQSVGLEANSLGDWTALRERLKSNVLDQMEREWSYSANDDMRAPPTWPPGKRIVLLSGESGQGKTWQLGALALDAFRISGLATIATATGDAERDIQSAADLVWQDTLDHDGSLPPNRLAKRLRKVAPNIADPWLTVCVDDVQDADEVRRLITHDWNRCGARLAISTSPSVARSMKGTYSSSVEVIDVQDFSLLELREYLELQGHEWGLLPNDVRALLTRPLLARLFCEVADKSTWIPVHEYDLFERFWLRLRDARSQANHPADVECVRILAATVIDETSAYPWPQKTVSELLHEPGAQLRLESIGWLRRLDGDRVEIWHDRLLNWAVAEVLVARRQANAITTGSLAERLARLCDPNRMEISGKFLGYVPMDVLWLAGDHNRGLRHELASLLEALEETPLYRGYPESLYERVLPTLGERIIEAMLSRVRATADREFNPYPRFVANAIYQIGSQQAQFISPWGRKLIDDPEQAVRDVGMRVLTKFPDSDALDRLWELHRASYAAYESKSVQDYWLLYDVTFSALRACVRVAPSWLIGAIESANPDNEPVSELAFLVASLEGATGRQIWLETKQTLFSKVPPKKYRSLARCIWQHSDDTEIERLEGWLDVHHDLVSPTAFSALVRLSPQRAIAGLQALRHMDLYTTRDWWIHGLLREFSADTLAAIRRLMQDNPDDFWTIALIFQGNEDLLDSQTLNLLLDELDRRCETVQQPPDGTSQVNLWHPVNLIAEVSRADLLDVIEDRANTTLEKRLTAIACIRVDKQQDPDLPGLQRVLLKINGPGFTELVNHELRSSNQHSQLHGVRWATVRPDSDTHALLRSISLSDGFWNGGDYPLLQKKAAVALAVLGENEAVVANGLRWGDVLQELAEVRQGQHGMSDRDLQAAIGMLASDNNRERTAALHILSISGRQDSAAKARHVLQENSPDDGLNRAAIWALGSLVDTHSETVDLIAPYLRIPANHHAAAVALARIGTSSALSELYKELLRIGIIPGSPDGLMLAANLNGHSEYRTVVAQQVWTTLAANPWWGCSYELLASVTELEDPKIREFLIRAADETDDGTHIVGKRASTIRALAKLDPESARRACQTSISMRRKGCELLPAILLEIDEDSAIQFLCDAGASASSTLVRHSIGRAFRLASKQMHVVDVLRKMLEAADSNVRFSAAELAGFLGPGILNRELINAASRDFAPKVCKAATDALCRQRRESNVAELLVRLKESTGSRSWSLLDAILDTADPYLLKSASDKLWIGAFLPAEKQHCWIHIRDRLQERIRDVDSAANKND
jgi:hypothetical protein